MTEPSNDDCGCVTSVPILAAPQGQQGVTRVIMPIVYITNINWDSNISQIFIFIRQILPFNITNISLNNTNISLNHANIRMNIANISINITNISHAISRPPTASEEWQELSCLVRERKPSHLNAGFQKVKRRSW